VQISRDHPKSKGDIITMFMRLREILVIVIKFAMPLKSFWHRENALRTITCILGSLVKGLNNQHIPLTKALKKIAIRRRSPLEY
jgi:hypothetical protein